MEKWKKWKKYVEMCDFKITVVVEIFEMSKIRF